MTKLGSGIYRSEDGGKTWKYLSRQNSRPFYYSHILLNPVDDQRVYYLTASFMKSEDGGKTWQNVPGLHPDYHAMWLDPLNKERYYNGQDAGAALTHDHGKTFIYFDNICAGQFYAVSADMRDPYYVYGGLQDNGTWGGPSMHREGGHPHRLLVQHRRRRRLPHAERPDRLAHRLRREPGRRGVADQRRDARVAQHPADAAEHRELPGLLSDDAAGPGRGAGPASAPQQAASPLRFNWSTPIYLSPHNPSTVYMGGNHLFRSLDRGDRWQIISPDLTTNDKSKLGPRQGGTMTPTGGMTTDDTGAETHCTIITISESTLRPGIIWVGTDDGNVQVTRDGGATWANVRANVPGVPKGTWVSRVEASRTARRHRVPDVRRPPQRRLQAVRLRDEGLREDLDEPRERHPGRPARLRHPRGSEERQPAVPRHRVRRVLLGGRGQAVDAA